MSDYQLQVLYRKESNQDNKMMPAFIHLIDSMDGNQAIYKTGNMTVLPSPRLIKRHVLTVAPSGCTMKRGVAVLIGGSDANQILAKEQGKDALDEKEQAGTNSKQRLVSFTERITDTQLTNINKSVGASKMEGSITTLVKPVHRCSFIE